MVASQERRRPGRPKKKSSTALVVLPTAELAFPLPDRQRSGFEAAFRDVEGSLNSDESRRAYEREWANFVSFISARNINVLETQTKDIQEYLLWMRSRSVEEGGPLGTGSRARALAVLRAVFGSLTRFGVVPTNPAREAKNPKGSMDRKTPVLTEDELARLISCIPSETANFAERRDYLIALTASYTGLRRSNLASIAIDRFRKVSDELWLVPLRVKGDKTKDAEIIAALADEIFAWCREHGITTGPIFRATPSSSTAISVGTVRNALKNQARRSGLPDLNKIAPHAFRRTFASMAERRGTGLFDLQRAMMHARVGTTQGYLQYAEKHVGVANSFADLMPSKIRDRRDERKRMP